LTGVELLNSHDFDFRHEAGFEVSLIHYYDYCRSVEGRYVSIENWEDTVNFNYAAANLYNTTPPTTFGGPALGVAEYDSEFESGEVNWRCDLHECAAVFIGFRYVRLDEELNILSSDPTIGDIEQQFWSTTNDLYGFQIGADAMLLRNCNGLRIDGCVRAGVFVNDSESHFRVDDFDDAIANRAFATADDTDAAFAGEMTLTVAYEICCTWTLHAGYTLLLVDGVALAGNQVAVTGNFNTAGAVPATLDVDGTVFAHGLTLGLTGVW
jgi:hypothetical protein